MRDLGSVKPHSNFASQTAFVCLRPGTSSVFRDSRICSPRFSRPEGRAFRYGVRSGAWKRPCPIATSSVYPRSLGPPPVTGPSPSGSARPRMLGAACGDIGRVHPHAAALARPQLPTPLESQTDQLGQEREAPPADMGESSENRGRVGGQPRRSEIFNGALSTLRELDAPAEWPQNPTLSSLRTRNADGLPVRIAQGPQGSLGSRSSVTIQATSGWGWGPGSQSSTVGCGTNV